MDQGSNPAPTPRSPSLALPKTTRGRTDTSALNSPGKMAGNRRSTSPTPCGRTKGKGVTKKRKGARASKESDHPSVAIALSWTNRLEQVEEVRAREEIYCAPKPDTSAVEKEETQDIPMAWWMGDRRADTLDPKPRAGRPWEWSAEDCEELLLVDALSCPKEVAEQSSDEMLGVEDESAIHESPRAAKSISMRRNGKDNKFSTAKAPNAVSLKSRNVRESPLKNPPARRVRGRWNGSTGMRMLETLSSCSGTQLDHAPSATECEAVSVRRKNDDTTASFGPNGQSTVKKKASRVCPLNPRSGYSSGKVDAMEDERKARELSATLNRNSPRRSRFEWCNPKLAEGDHDSEAPGAESNHVDLKDHKSGKRDKNGKSKRSSLLMRKRLAIDTGTRRGTSAASFDPTTPRKVLEVHPWVCAGLEFGLGTKAEVWWNDSKWYKCCISKISYDGRCGELEFLPYHRKVNAREFSIELDLEELIREGNLVLPGTHLEWTVS